MPSFYSKSRIHIIYLLFSTTELSITLAVLFYRFAILRVYCDVIDNVLVFLSDVTESRNSILLLFITVLFLVQHSNFMVMMGYFWYHYLTPKT